MLFNGKPNPEFDNKFILGTSTNCLGESGLGPIRVDATPTTEALNNIYSQGPFNNLGVPGAKVTHLEYNGFGNPANLSNGTANPYYVRMASSANSSVLEDALAQNPTFFSLWIGNNDVLGYATSGGIEPVTGQATFSAAYNSIVDKLVASGAKGVVANIPNVTSIPYFTTVPWNMVPLDAASANNMTIIFRNIADKVDQDYGAGKGDPYRIEFVEGGNPIFVYDSDLNTYPLGFRQIKSNELVLLTYPTDSLRCHGYGFFVSEGFKIGEPIDTTIARVKPAATQYVLTEDEIAVIETTTSGYNSTISAAAQKHNLALADMHTHLAEIRDKGYKFSEVEYTTSFVTGGAFSLDGVHLTPRGYAIVANYFIDAINAKYTSNLPKANVNSYPGLDLP
jgi:hypothetical protein